LRGTPGGRRPPDTALMTEERPDTEINSASRPVEAGVPDTDELMFSEGVGGLPDLEDEQRATVGDVDGDNVEDDEDLL
jgi:hypothetical protein